MTESSDSQARRVAKRFGLRARKSRWRRDTVDNHGGYMLIDPHQNYVVAGSRFNLTAADVVELCDDMARRCSRKPRGRAPGCRRE